MDPGATGSRSEAVRNMIIAERLLAVRDLVGCKRFAELALEHDPLVDGVDHVLAIADVLLASQNHPGNPFAVLGLEPSTVLSDPSAPRRQYRRLALLLRPDRNPHPSAAQAFKALSDAFSAVSSKSQENKDPSTFWTACPSCCHVHQYAREYLDRNLRCPSCSRAFRAAELPSPPPVVPGTDSYFCSWGFFPIGFPTSPLDPQWKPFIPLFPQNSNPDAQNPDPNRQNPNNNPREAGDSDRNGGGTGTAGSGRSKKVARKKVEGNVKKKTLSAERTKVSGININEMAGGSSEGRKWPGEDVEFHIDLDSTEELLGNLQNLPFLKDEDIPIRVPIWLCARGSELSFCLLLSVFCN